MKKWLIGTLMLYTVSFPAQKKDNCKDILNKWDDWDVYKMPTIESVKKMYLQR